jgi:type II secretory pathway pseudopilin PulG
MVELLVVIAIMVLLAGLVIGIGSWSVEQGRKRDTAGLLKHLDDAIEQFRLDAPLARVQAFMDRYGGYPPDELEPFDKDNGIPGTNPKVLISPNSDAKVVLTPGSEHADIKAMVLAIRVFGSEEAQQILERIDTRFRGMAPAGDYWDRNGNGTFDPGDEQLAYYVDSWGLAVEYFAIAPGQTAAAPSDPTSERLDACKWLVGLNKRRPLFVSYGPDGPDQFSKNFETEAQNLVADYADDGKINNRFNADNVYSTEGFAEKLRQ